MIYVRDGDKALGTWGRVFIFAQQVRRKEREVFTARSGRIDSSGDTVRTGSLRRARDEVSGMVSRTDKQYVVERSEQLRFQSIRAGPIVQKLNERDTNADSMDWTDCASASRPALTCRKGKRYES